MSLQNQGEFLFFDLDMGAAHTRIARYLLSDEKSQLDSSLTDSEFWKTQIEKALPYFQKREINREPAVIKKLLKVGIYTSLNGKNPSSTDRLLANLSLNAENFLKENSFVSIRDIETSAIYKATREALHNFKLVQEVKSRNEKCSLPIQVNEKERILT
jgi:hypothetical protein